MFRVDAIIETNNSCLKYSPKIAPIKVKAFRFLNMKDLS